MEKIKIVIDAMGGDHAPDEVVKGAIAAIAEDRELILCGPEAKIQAKLKEYGYKGKGISVVNATEVIEMAEPPVKAIRSKKDSSIVVGMNLVKKGEADAFVSAGSTGAVLVGGQLIVGRIRGVERPPLAPLLPTETGECLLIDCGANVDARASHLVQFAKLGSIYMKNMKGIENPRVGIVNIGAEEEKGNALVKETFPLLKECEDINFIGSVEARDIPKGVADVVVCEAFVGNVILKLFEGVGSALMNQVTSVLKTNIKTMIGALLIKKNLKKTLKRFVQDDQGGAPLLGLNGLVVKAHGSSTARDITNAINTCVKFSKADINGQVREALGRKKESPES